MRLLPDGWFSKLTEFLELSVEMGLVGEAGLDRDLRQGFAGGNHSPRALKPAHHQETMRAGRKSGAEMPR